MTMIRTPEGGPSILPRYPLIQIDGTIGVGKTTLAKLLAGTLGADLIGEPFNVNPYLEKFYTKNPSKYSSDAQAFFLSEDVAAMSKVPEMLLSKPVIVDGGEPENSRIAEVQHLMGWMSGEECRSYENARKIFYRQFKLPKPDLIFLVTGKTEGIIKKIVERGREMELLMLKKYPSYFREVANSYKRYVGKIRRSNSKFREIDSDKFNIVANRVDKNYVIEQLLLWTAYYLTSEHQLNGRGRDGRELLLPEVLKEVGRGHTQSFISHVL